MYNKVSQIHMNIYSHTLAGPENLSENEQLIRKVIANRKEFQSLEKKKNCCFFFVFKSEKFFDVIK